ncbi:MAG: hypothetical protein HKN72_17400, partial [Gemmatimonadetes bacterium]|nr:hypothetical protein [Gemmatimonadota bacterium]
MRATIGIGMSISMLAGCAVEDLKSPCTDCVSAEVVLRLGELDGRMALTESRGVTFDSVGSLWISQGHYLVVADSLGDFVREVGA